MCPTPGMKHTRGRTRRRQARCTPNRPWRRESFFWPGRRPRPPGRRRRRFRPVSRSRLGSRRGVMGLASHTRLGRAGGRAPGTARRRPVRGRSGRVRHGPRHRAKGRHERPLRPWGGPVGRVFSVSSGTVLRENMAYRVSKPTFAARLERQVERYRRKASVRGLDESRVSAYRTCRGEMLRLEDAAKQTLNASGVSVSSVA